jgi:hypothetical protein
VIAKRHREIWTLSSRIQMVSVQNRMQSIYTVSIPCIIDFDSSVFDTLSTDASLTSHLHGYHIAHISYAKTGHTSSFKKSRENSKNMTLQMQIHLQNKLHCRGFGPSLWFGSFTRSSLIVWLENMQHLECRGVGANAIQFWSS